MRSIRNCNVCMILKKQLWDDARVKKEALSLAGAGLNVTIVCQPEEGSPPVEDWRGIKVVRTPRSGGFKATFRKVLDSTGESGDGNGRGLIRRIVKAIRMNPVKRFLGDIFHSTVYQLRLLFLALREGADVYHAHDLDTLAVCAAAAVLTGTSYVYDSHELWLGSNRHLAEPSRFNRWMDGLTERCLVGGAAAVIAVTPGRADVMREMYPRMPEPTLIPNYPPAADPVPLNDDIRRSLGAWEGSCYLFLYQGVLAPKRGLEQLMEASMMLRGLPLHVAIVGHDASGNSIRDYAEQASVWDMVTFHPPVPSERLPEITGSADAGVLLFQDSCLNHNLSLPNKLFEYMMAGLPIIACDLPEISQVIRKHECGIVVDASDPGSIAEGMRRLVEDPEEATAMGRRGNRAASSHYRWSVSEKTLRDMYSRIMH